MSHAQLLGRFGYTPFPEIPGFRIDAAGFRSSSAGADTFRFDRVLAGFTGYSITDRTSLSLGPYYDGCPSQFRYNLRSSGFEMYFPRSMRIWLGSLQSPILSWGEGSVSADVPTPPSNWFLVSFQDNQPPVLIVFEDSQATLIVRGSSGRWSITTLPGYRGWVRVCLPLGHHRSAAVNAAALGEQVAAVVNDKDFWIGDPPILQDFTIKSDETSLTAIWTFDRPGALVPIPALMAKTGGYPIQILTGIKRLSADLTEGPTAYATEPRIAIKFPLQRIPFGRSLMIGPRPLVEFGEASPFSVAGLCNLALESLLPDRKEDVVTITQNATDEFYARSRRFFEPFTKQRLPYPQSGEGIDILAAHALVQQARALSGELSGNVDDPFLQTQLRVDWATWMVWADKQSTSRRASGILSVAAAISHDPERRALGVMLQAGLASERALELYRKSRNFIHEEAELLEPMFGLREGLFMSEPNAFVSSLMSEVRVSTRQRIVVEAIDDGVLVKFTPAKSGAVKMEFEIGRPVNAAPLSNLRSFVSNQVLGRLTVECYPNGIGECSFILKSPGWTTPLPFTVAPPAYSESR